MIVAVTGGRGYADKAAVWRELDALAPHLLLVGDCPTGADRYALEWAECLNPDHGCLPQIFCADWAKHGKAAGPIRNREMLAAKPDMLLAFPGGRGTADCVRQARQLGVAVVSVAP